jgi:sodium/bile acid cotransporter 7
LLVLTTTFVIFPTLGMAARALVPSVLTIDVYNGLLFLCLVPSTVQSSIAFTSIARGHVSAAIVSASLSNILGVVLSPLPVVLLMNTSGAPTVRGGASPRHRGAAIAAVRGGTAGAAMDRRAGRPACGPAEGR